MEQTTAGRWSRAFRAAFPATIPVLTGFLCLGLAYGVLMETKGYGPLWSTLMSAVAFGGSMQYVAITLLTTAFDPLQAFLLSVMVNARHIFYGLSLLDKYKGLGKAPPYRGINQIPFMSRARGHRESPGGLALHYTG